MRENDHFVVLEWSDDAPGYARYSFATVKHAEELGANVRWVHACASLEAACRTATELNQPGAANPVSSGETNGSASTSSHGALRGAVIAHATARSEEER